MIHTINKTGQFHVDRNVWAGKEKQKINVVSLKHTWLKYKGL